MAREDRHEQERYGQGYSNIHQDRWQEGERSLRAYGSRGNAGIRGMGNGSLSRCGSGSMRGNESTTNRGSYSQGLYGPPQWLNEARGRWAGFSRQEGYTYPEEYFGQNLRGSIVSPPDDNNTGTESGRMARPPWEQEGWDQPPFDAPQY